MSTRNKKDYICKSEAKNDYYLTDKDLIGLTILSVRNPHYRKAPNMTLYLKKDIIRKFKKKYKIKNKDNLEETLKELEIKRKMKSDNVKLCKKQKRDIRKFKLVEELKKAGVKLRSDSKLCHGYIDGIIKDWTIPQIVRRTCEMKYLYEYCHMEKCFKIAKREDEKELNAGYYPDEPLFDHAEGIALQKYTKHNRYPKVFPWQK